MVLNYLTQNYKSVDLVVKSSKVKGSSPPLREFKVTLKIDGKSFNLIIPLSTQNLSVVLLPALLKLLNTRKIGKKKILSNLSVLKTWYFAHQRAEAKSVKNSKSKKENSDAFGDLKVNPISYEFHLQKFGKIFYQGQYWVYYEVRDKSGSLVESKDKKDHTHGVLYDTNLWTEKNQFRVKGLEIWTVVKLKKGDVFEKPKQYQSVMVHKVEQRRVIRTEHLEFYNVFMHYKIQNALDLFFFHFLNGAVE